MADTNPVPLEPDVPPGCTKLTVYVKVRAMEALVNAAAVCNDTKTDTVSRALRVYEQIVTAEPGTSFSFDGISLTVGVAS